MKKMLLLFALAISFSAFPAVTAAGQPTTVQVNGWDLSLELSPVLREGRMLVPVRPIAEALGTTVLWDATNRTVTVADPTRQVKLAVDSPVAFQNGRQLKLDVPARVENGRMLVPLRFIAEALGAAVEWRPEGRQVAISREYSYLKSALNGNEYWLNTQSGELYLVPGAGTPAKIGSLQHEITDIGHITAEQTPQGNVLLTITDTYGEPHIFDTVYSVYLRDNKIMRLTMVDYFNRPPGITFYRQAVVMTDGRKAYLLNDATGEVEKTYDLVALGGEDDKYIIEGIGENFLLIRPNRKGFMTLVYPDTGKKVLLYKELLSEIEQDYAETAGVPFEGDYLKYTGTNGEVLYFRNDSPLQKDEQIYQYPLSGSSQL